MNTETITASPSDTAEAPVRPDQTQERLLLRRIANGDRVGFEELHTRFAGLVYATIYHVLRDHQDTEDISQEVFLSIWTASAPRNAVPASATLSKRNQIPSLPRPFQMPVT